MKAIRTTPNGRLTIEVDAASVPQAIEKLAIIDEVFGETECGQCHSKDIYFTFRNPEGNAYYGMRCKTCGGDLWIHQHRDGKGMYIKRSEGKNGWTEKYIKGNEGAGESRAAPQPTERRDERPKEPVETPF